MKGSEWIKYIKYIEKDSQNWPQLKNFFRLIISLFFLFPSLIQSLLIDKEKFVVYLSRKSNFWEIRWLTQYFEFRINDSFRNYLHQEDWWWYFFKKFDAENNYLEPYFLSNFHESMSKKKERKSTGIFFTPMNQIKVICHYALFFFLRNRNNIAIDDKSLYQLVFRSKYPIHFQLKDNQQIANVLLSIRILDPSCGTGMFLAEMCRLLLSVIFANPIYVNISPEERLRIINKTFSHLHGFDIDSNSIKYAKIILLQQYFQKTQNGTFSQKELEFFFNRLQIYETNFISENNTSPHKFDIIIGNPPYVRHHGLLNASIKGLKDNKNFFQDLFPKTQIKWDRKADLYIYFWIKAITQVVEGGVIAFVLSRAWVSSRYTNPLKQVFGTFFYFDLILELPFEVWKSAEIRTHIVVGHRADKNAKLENMAIIVWKKSLESLLQFETQKFTNKLETLSLLYNNSRLEFNTKETDSYRITLISDLTPLLINSRKIFPFLRLDYLTMSSYLAKLLIDKKDQFCLLKDLGKLEMGSTTGANRFFYLNKKLITKYRIPEENLYLMTKSPKEWRTILSPSKELKCFLHIPNKLSDESSLELRDYIKNIQPDILKRPYFKNKTKNNWYQVPLVQPEILIPNMIFKRSFVTYNSDKLHIDKQWIGFWVNNQGWLFFLLGFLNSTLGILLREVQGTRTLGLGSLKLSLQECHNLLVLDPRKLSDDLLTKFQTCISRLGEMKIEPIHQTQELPSEYSKVQKQLDYLVLVECLGLNPVEITKIQEILKFELYWRFAKEIRGNHEKINQKQN